MTERRSHFLISGFSDSEKFSTKNHGWNRDLKPQKNGKVHGEDLSDQFTNVLKEYDASRKQAENPITKDIGIYVEITSADGFDLPLEKLDNIDFNLHSCRKVDKHEVALVFIPESRRESFHKKLTEYLDSDKDGKGGRPRNRDLIDSIAKIKLANIKSFWTDDPDCFPKNVQQKIWWELWLKNIDKDQTSIDIATQLAKRIDATLGNTSISFFDSTVFLIEASVSQLENAVALIANLVELRKAQETPNALIRSVNESFSDGLRKAQETPNALIKSSPKEQQEWTKNLASRLRIENEPTAAVCILDTGVNYNHQLLCHFSNQDQAECWRPTWHHYDAGDPCNDNAHGSRQAGIASFGDLHAALLTDDEISIPHTIESGRILPPVGANERELYGAITVETAKMHEGKRPHLNRVFSLAVTSPAVTSANNYEGGQPSSWSSEIDQFSSGYTDDSQRLFVISTGNNTALNTNPDYWEQVQLAQIEDPAQSWNALTVGAYTEKTTNDDPNFEGWTPFAKNGDIAPASRSSVDWGWKKQAPLKPDIVAEGGNRLISLERTEISNADVVSLLTTSGRTTGQLFETTGDTSAASALVSRQAAILMTEYTEYWPETIRGLIVHSASWTPKMWDQYKSFKEKENLSVAKETMLRVVGHGVPNLERARYSADHALTLIAQDSLQPFVKRPEAKKSADPIFNEMHLYKLPWPIEVLQQMSPELKIELKVTLSYFIEPNPGRKGYRSRYSYQSHGLRFEVIRPGHII